MEFKALRNLDNSFQQLRLFAIIFAVLCLFVTCFFGFQSYKFANKQREKIYVLDQGKSLMLALSQDTEVNRPVEAREHVRRFHELFFTLAPEATAIESNMKRAFVLCDGSARSYYKDLSEERYYNRIIATYANQVIEIDSIVGDFNVYPYSVVTYAKLSIYRKTRVTERSLVTACQLSNSVRSDDNPQGFLMEDFRVIENKDIKTTDRER